MISLNQKALVASNNKSSLANNSLVIQDTIDNLNGLLNEAVSARVMNKCSKQFYKSGAGAGQYRKSFWISTG